MDYDYVVPDNLKQQLVVTLKTNNCPLLSELLMHATLDFNDVGLAHYAGMNGNTWNKHALDCNIYIHESKTEVLKRNVYNLKLWLQRLMPPASGLLIRDVVVIPRLDYEHVEIPEITGEKWDVLYADIAQALSRNEPALVLDRLHTFSTKFLRDLCTRKGIDTLDDKGHQQPLHSLVGMLTKCYQKNGAFQSDFSPQAMKMSISLFEKYNGIRNDQSYAHDNEILNDLEAMFAVRIMAATIAFIHAFESKEQGTLY